MKRWLCIGLICVSAVAIYQPQKSKNKVPGHHSFSLFEAQAQVEPAAFIQKVETAAKGSKQQFLQFLLQTNAQGYTSLIVAAILADVEQINYLMQLAIRKFGDDPEAFLKFVNFQDKKMGNTALLFAIYTGRLNTVRAIVEPTKKVIGKRKDLFLKFLNQSDFQNENNPLILTSWDGSSRVIHYLVNEARDVFGKDSDEFYHFINYRDNDEYTPLGWVEKPQDRDFLIKNGGNIFKKTPASVAKAHEWGRKLVDAIYNADFNTIKEVMTFARSWYEKTKNPDLYVEIICYRTPDGTMPIPLAAEQGARKVLRYLISQVLDVFKDDTFTIYDILRNVDRDGRNALYLAVERGHYDIVVYLIDVLSKHAPDKYYFYMFFTRENETNGFTPLIIGVYERVPTPHYYQMVQLLVKPLYFPMGTRGNFLFINDKDLDGNSAIDYANSLELFNLLRRQGACLPIEAIRKIRSGHEELLP